MTNEPLFLINTCKKEAKPLNEEAKRVKEEYIEETGSEKYFTEIIRLCPNTIEKVYIKDNDLYLELELMDLFLENYVKEEINNLGLGKRN